MHACIPSKITLGTIIQSSEKKNRFAYVSCGIVYLCDRACLLQVHDIVHMWVVHVIVQEFATSMFAAGMQIVRSYRQNVHAMFCSRKSWSRYRIGVDFLQVARDNPNAPYIIL